MLLRRSTPGTRGRGRALAFGASLALLGLALMSPVARLGEQMFAWHMLQHLLLLDAVPILLLLGCDVPLVRALGRRLPRASRALSRLTLPVAAIALYATALWAIHAPPLFELALRASPAHWVQHALLIAVGLLFWWHPLAPGAMRRRFRGPAVAGYMVSAKVLTGALATVIMFTDLTTYDVYEGQPRFSGLTIEEDREAAGGLMLVWEVMVMAAAFAFMFIRMLEDSEREQQLHELDPPTRQAEEPA